MLLSPHFPQAQFETDAPLPPETIPVYTALCDTLLEPLRVHYNEPITITSGYRNPTSNAAAHGVSNSQHIANGNYCAADWYVGSLQHDMRPVFDLVRGSSLLEFDQLILEHGTGGDIIHSSWSRVYNRREALEGDVANESAYKPWPSVPEVENV